LETSKAQQVQLVTLDPQVRKAQTLTLSAPLQQSEIFQALATA
jgi:hypothetical protein